MAAMEKLKSCPNCGTPKNKSLYTAKEWDGQLSLSFSECSNCGIVFLDERFIQKDIDDAYGHGYEPYKEKSNFLGDIFNWWRTRKEIDLFKKYNPEAKYLLEIGSSWGKFIKSMRDKGFFKVTGVEISKEAVDLGKSKHGLDIRIGDLENQNFETKSFDIVVMNHVIEHLYNPLGTLKEVSRIMSDSGILLIKTPNIKTFERSLFGKYWGAYDVPRHIMLFDERSLTGLLHQAGLKKVMVKYEKIPNNLILSSKNYLISKKVPDWLVKSLTINNPIILLIFSPISFLMSSFRKSGRMVILATKTN